MHGKAGNSMWKDTLIWDEWMILGGAIPVEMKNTDLSVCTVSLGNKEYMNL